MLWMGKLPIKFFSSGGGRLLGSRASRKTQGCGTGAWLSSESVLVKRFSKDIGLSVGIRASNNVANVVTIAVSIVNYCCLYSA